MTGVPKHWIRNNTKNNNESQYSRFYQTDETSFQIQDVFLSKLPSAYFAGVRVRKLDEKKCEVYSSL